MSPRPERDSAMHQHPARLARASNSGRRFSFSWSLQRHVAVCGSPRRCRECSTWGMSRSFSRARWPLLLFLGAVIATAGCGEEKSSSATFSDSSSGDASLNESGPGPVVTDSSVTSSSTALPTTSSREAASSERRSPDETSSERAASEAASDVSSDSSAGSDGELSTILADTSSDDGNTGTGDASTLGSSDQQSTAGETANICTEVVPAERYVDGIPAYAQCEASESGGVWSVDGVSTSTAQQGDWRRTQWGGGYQCTEFASRYLYFVWGVGVVPDGNAGAWRDCLCEPIGRQIGRAHV